MASGDPWAPHEDGLLIENMTRPTRPWCIVAQELGRSENSVKTRASDLRKMKTLPDRDQNGFGRAG